MHELSLCRAIADSVMAHAGGRRVEAVRLQVGHFRQVVPSTLAYCWSVHTAGTALDGARLDIIEVPAVIRCAACGEDTTLVHPVLRCPGCDTHHVTLISGEEFLIESIDVAAESLHEVR